MHGNEVDIESNDMNECNTDESIFDDAVEENDVFAVVAKKAGLDGNKRHKKRKIKSRNDKFLDLLQAVKRRRRQEEFERQLDPERFDDGDDPFRNDNPPNALSRSFKGTRKKKNIDIKSAIVNVDGDSTVGESMDVQAGVASPEETKTSGDTPDTVETGRDRIENPKEENDDKTSTSSNYFKFDERKFFSLPAFPPGVKEEAFRRIYAAIEAPLKALEEDGYEAYRQYIEDNDVEDSCDESRINDARGRSRDKKKKSSFKGVFRKERSKKNQRDDEKKREESIRNSLTNAIVNGDPREYQRRIFEIARRRNTIVNLGTGAGKTLIALLLIREVWSTQSSLSPNEKSTEGDNQTKNQTKKKKQTLFLVPSVALAIQQSLTLRANLPHLNVETVCDANSSSKRRRAILEKCDVIVATHGAIQDLLLHYGDMFCMDGFNLVVIDECHYASSGNHSYRYLMNKFYHPLELHKRPRILGLTASPLLNVKESHDDEQLSSMLDNLEKTLDSKMVSATGSVPQDESERTEANLVASVSTKRDTSSFLHRVIDEQVLDYSGKNMNHTIPSADNLELLPSRYREFKQLEQLYKDLGPLVLSVYCGILSQELSRNIFENESTLQYNRAVDHLKRIEQFCSYETKFLPNMGRNDKILALEELIERLIEEQGGAKTIGLVFVERRITAIALHCYFLWRNQRILDGNRVGTTSDWKFATKARREKLKSDSYFQLKIGGSQGDQGDDEDDRFDDSIDDPLRRFQESDNSRHSTSIKPYPNGVKESSNDISQFMDADSEGEEADCGPRGSSKDDLFHRLGRVLVKPVALVRNAQVFNSLSMTQKQFKDSEKEDLARNWVHRELNIRDVLNKLRRGDVNLMFATSVVEEGVDVQACSFVVAFDGLTNIKGYIQMKGRARKQDAKFFVFRDPNCAVQSQMQLSVARKMECRMKRFIEERMRLNAPKISDILVQKDSLQTAIALPKEIAAIEAGVYKVGGATVDLQSAKSLLNRYFLSIPLDPFVRYRKESLLSYMPCFEGSRLVLPVHLPSDVRTVVLPPTYENYQRREKEKLLSLMACVRLHCYGLLNNRLLPLTRKDMQSRILQVATQKLQKIETIPLNLDSFFSDDRRHFVVYPLKQRSPTLSKYCDGLGGEGHSLGLITAAPMKAVEPFQLFHSQFGKVEISFGTPIFVSCSASQHEIIQQIFTLLMNSRWSRRSRNMFYEMRTKDQYDAVIPPYLVGILSSDGELDWNLMRELVTEKGRSVEERTFKSNSFWSPTLVSKPRICCTLHNQFVSYVVFGPIGETCDAKFPHESDDTYTYCDYYKEAHALEIPSDCPLFRARRIWSFDSGMPTKPRPKSSGVDSGHSLFESVEIPEQLLIEEPLANAQIALLCVFLPQVLYWFERQQKTEAFIKHCETHIPTLGECFRKMELSQVALAVTSRSCNPNENYDGWEWVGDAVLKLLQTDSLLKSSKFKHFVRFLHEGDLTVLRSAMGTNERLRQICAHLRLEKFIMMTALARGKWIPSPLQLCTAKTKVEEDRNQPMKIFADVIESILGVIYLEFGYHASMKVGNELRVTFPWDETDTSVACGEEGDIENSHLLNLLEKCAGHREPFSRPKIVSEAFTHPSAIDVPVPSYQRLEWIGDAVLCLCTREWLFRNLGEKTSLGDLVVSEGAIVCNETLGFLSMKFGLQEFLNHRDPSLPKRIESYYWNIQEGCGFWGGDPPKPIADMVEAILGAIHVSCGFESGQRATKHLMSSIFSLFEQASSQDSSALKSLLRTIKHPKKSLQEMSGQLLDVMVCSEHDFASSYDIADGFDWNSTTTTSIPQTLNRGEWRNAARGIERGSDSRQVAFVSILGRPLLVVGDESITVAKNRASSLVREAIERHPELQERLAKCRSNVECGLTFANEN